MKIWIGRRESDILTYTPNYFDYSITYYGSNKNNNFSFSTINRDIPVYSKKFINFINKKIQFIISASDKYELHFYSIYAKNKLVEMYPIYCKHCKNCNDSRIINWLDNKTYTRLWFSNSVQVPKFSLLSKSECTYENLKAKFPKFDEYVLQLNYSAGGDGTYKINERNKDVNNQLNQNYPYLVSPYYAPSISACCHVIIGKDETIIFPLGEQIISKYDSRLSYRGTRYDLEKRISSCTLKKCYDFIETLSSLLSINGYRGICGYDFLIYKGSPLFIEVNPRYMGSSYLINYMLSINHFPSLFEINTMAFENKSLKELKVSIHNIETNFETQTLLNESGKIFSNSIEIPNLKHLYDDGLLKSKIVFPNALLYRYFYEL